MPQATAAPEPTASAEPRLRSGLDDRVKDRALGAIIASAGLGTLFVVAAIRQRRQPKAGEPSRDTSARATYDDLTSSSTSQRAADDSDEVVFAEDASGARASSPRRGAPRWPWMLGAIGVGAVTALAVQRLSQAEPVLLEMEEEEVIIPLDDPIAGN